MTSLLRFLKSTFAITTVFALVVGCAVATPPQAPQTNTTITDTEFQALADALTDSLQEKDELSFSANFADSTMGQRLATLWFGNLSQMRQVTFAANKMGALTVSWSVAAGDVPAVHKVIPQLAKADGRTLIMDAMYEENPPIWFFGKITVHDTVSGTLISAENVPTDRITNWLRYIDKAVETVKAAKLGTLVTDWDQNMIVEIPSNTRNYQLLAGMDPEISGAATECENEAVHVVINPSSLQLPAAQAAAVATHEAVHVATGSPCLDIGALWASEGLSESVTAAKYPETKERNSASVLTYLAQNGIPQALPSDADFSGASQAVGAAYALSQVAVDAIFANMGKGDALELLSRFTRTPRDVDTASVKQVTTWYRAALEEIMD